jgi:hypothetical protein
LRLKLGTYNRFFDPRGFAHRDLGRNTLAWVKAYKTGIVLFVGNKQLSVIVN